MKTAAVIATCLATFVLLGAQPQREMFSKYKSLEVYEVRQTVAAVPRYTADGHVCEVSLQRLLASPDRVNLDPNLSDQEINAMVDDLVPNEERGARVGGPGIKVEVSGNTAVGTVSYANIDVETFRDAAWDNSKSVKTLSIRNIRLAVIRWKNRKCQ